MPATDDKVASPKDGIVAYDDADCHPSYIALPDDFMFVESAAYDEDYNADKFYIPVQRTGGKTYIYEASVTDTEAKLLCGPITLKDDKWTDDQKVRLTAFGSEIDKNGRLWLCIFNRNLVVAVDLASANPAVVTHEVELFAPNDVCIDPNDPNVLYAVVGKKRALFTDPSAGQVKKVVIQEDGSPPVVTKISGGKNTLAGIEATKDGQVLVAQLFNMFRLMPPQDETKFWDEDYFWNAHDGKGKMWLADNISPLGTDGMTFMAPAYNVCNSGITESILRSRVVTSVGNFTAQVVSAVMNSETTREALEDPEVDVAFSNNDSPDPLRFIKMSNVQNGQASPMVEHFEVHLKEAHARTKGITEGRKFYFDTNVTAVLCVKNRLICINFQHPRLLLLDLDKFYKDGEQEEIVNRSVRMNAIKQEESQREQSKRDLDDEKPGFLWCGMCGPC